jgi:hypothetical protein
MTTLGGLVFRLFGRLPQVGEAVDYEGYHFHVLGIDGLRISRVEVSKVATPASDSDLELEAPDSAGLLAFQSSDGGAESAGEAQDGLTAEQRAKRKRKRKKRAKAKARAAAEAEEAGKQAKDSGSESVGVVSEQAESEPDDLGSGQSSTERVAGRDDATSEKQEIS